MRNNITGKTFTLHDENLATLKYTLGKEYGLKGLQLDLAFDAACANKVGGGVDWVHQQFSDIVAIIYAGNI